MAKSHQIQPDDGDAYWQKGHTWPIACCQVNGVLGNKQKASDG